jgi:NTE family protein
LNDALPGQGPAATALPWIPEVFLMSAAPHALNQLWRLCCLVLVGIACFTGSATWAADEVAASAPRPKIGLVLAGGGAKGGAHIGVLKVLEELHVPIDCIAGTSMGALVGGGYASGIDAADLETFVTGIDWARVVGGLGMRDLEPIEQKRSSVTYSNQIELGLQHGELIIPAGIINTSNIENLLRSYVATSRNESDFDRLPIPFRAVATDMLSGEMVVLRQGDLATAMRASMAIPGAFAPVEIEDYILSDGGMVRNVPVDVARELCADVVIVVNLVEPSPQRDKLRTATQLASRSMDVMFQVNENISLASLTGGDVRIDVPMGDIATASFDRIPETIPLGEAAARGMAGPLSALAVSGDEYTAWRNEVNTSQDVEARLAGVEIEGLERVNRDYLKAKATVHEGDVVDSAQINAEASRLLALQDFTSVGYRLEGEPGSESLVWLPKEKDYGPNYVRFDLGLYVSEGGDLAFNIYAQHRRTWMNRLGGQWQNDIQLGRENFLITSFYQPLDTSQTFFVQPTLFLNRSDEDVFYENERVATYRFGDYGGQFDAGVNIGNRFQARLGYVFTHRVLSVETGSPLLPETSTNDGGLMVQAIFDSRNTRFSPTSGMAAALEYISSDESLGGDRSWDRGEIGLGLAVPVFTGDVLWVTLAGGTSFEEDLPPDRAFALGGPASFPGFELGELRVNDYWTVGTNYLWKFRDTMAIRGEALYAGLGLTAGQVYGRVSKLPGEDLASISAYLTGRTIVGPLMVGVAATTTESWSLWLSVGRPVGHGTILESGIFR